MQKPEHLNPTRQPTIAIPCILCRGLNPNCTACIAGKVIKKSCLRCGGMGADGGASCMDCKGQGWRQLDNDLITP